jgi:hypothetical protein
MRCPRSGALLLLLATVLALPSCGASSDVHAMGMSRKTYVIPHVLETKGRVSLDPNTMNTTIYATYVGGRNGVYDGGGATVELYLYDDSGKLMAGTGGADVCAPCTFQLSSTTPKVTISVQDAIDGANAWNGSTVRTGFGVIVVSGDADGVNLQGFVVNSHTSAFDLSVFGFEPQPLAAAR